jgi:methionyl-tRNA synthetase
MSKAWKKRGGGHERVCHPARGGQPEDDPGAHARAVHGTQKLHEYLGYEGQLFGAQKVVEYQEETRARRALTYDHSGAVGTHSLRFPRLHSGQAVQAWTKSELPPGQALRQPTPLFKKMDESVIEEECARPEG